MIPKAYFEMTAVSPYIIPVETVIDVEDETLSGFGPELLFANNNNGEKPESTVKNDENNIAPKSNMTIEDGLRPLLASMKLFGLYFNRQSDQTDGEDIVKNARRWNATTIYGAVVVTVLWINSVRMLSAFKREDRFGMELFGKLIIVIWSFQCAMSQTAFYAASFSGRLALVFRQPLAGPCAKHARKFATVYALIAWSVIIVGSAFSVYTMFFTNGMYDLWIAPIKIHIDTPNLLIPRIISVLISFHTMAAYIFGQATTFVLASIFTHQFKKISMDLGSCLDNPRRHVSELDIETFRQKHQQISMTVGDIDDCLMFSNASAFCCQLSCVVILLYSLIFYLSFVTDPVVIIMHIYWMILFLFGLTLTAAGGIMVHHYVSSLYLPCVFLFAAHCLLIVTTCLLNIKVPYIIDVFVVVLTSLELTRNTFCGTRYLSHCYAI